MTPREVTDELERMAERYKMEEDRRRVRMVAQPQNAGNTQAIPETPQSGPDLDEYAYVGAPSPPVQGAESMVPSMGLPAPLQSLAQKYRDAPPTVASTGGTTPFLQPAAREFFTGNDRSIMEPDLLTSQRGGYSEHELPPHMTSKDGTVVFRDTGEPVPVTRRPGALPLTVNAASGKMEFAMPRGFDVTGASMPSTKGAMIARGLGMTPMELAPGEVALGAGAVKGTRRPPPEPGAPYPQYAERYPEPGPPTPTLKDPKKPEKGTYDAKQLTPEAEEFQKARQKIADDMEEKGFTPHFDPAKREYVDPANYPTSVNTLEAVPKKEATAAKHMERAGADEARAALQEAYARGSKLPDAKDWYAMKQLEDAFIKELGPEAGRKAFADKFAGSMAATTGGADPQGNFLMAMYGNYLKQHGLPTPETHQMPFPIGGRYAGGNMEMFDKLAREYGIQSLDLTNPKRHDFAYNFLGHRNKATMDEQMTSGMTPGVAMPPWYGIWEKVLHEEAAKAGVSPMNFQDVAWAGFKNKKDPTFKGEPMIQVVNRAIERTHRLTGMPHEEIVRRGIVRSEIPIYSRAPVTAPPRGREDE